MSNQEKRVLDLLYKYPAITAKLAMDKAGIYRLGARIWDLKKAGIPIQDRWVEEVNRYGEKTRVKQYFLPAEAKHENERT